MLREILTNLADGHTPSIVTIGTFDGVHRGHQRLLAEVSRRAHLQEARAIALSFNPRPAEVLRPGVPSFYLCTVDERVERLRSAGADTVAVVPFTREVAHTTALEFVMLLVEALGMRELVGGPDLALGRGREGTPEVLRALGDRLGFSLDIMPALEIHGEAVHSSEIHRLLKAGNLEQAAAFLGRPYQVSGQVVHGEARGRTIGVPTANVVVPEMILLPRDGIYAVHFYHDGRRWPGAASLGYRPTFDGTTRLLEVHVLDFEGDLYGATCQVEFVRWLRPELRYESVKDLIKQIAQDVQEVRYVLGIEERQLL
ncbi:MAG TPA: bifunctional riboflavin kinase/FAD synthetase [Chloroflexota bacterium]|nr:bifunctional riboflavin kinase/FAD synthetase [Chloroflexota bacterium]